MAVGFHQQTIGDNIIRTPVIPCNEARGATCTKSAAQRSGYTSDAATKLQGINEVRISLNHLSHDSMADP